jgi:hypothetical protein
MQQEDAELTFARRGWLWAGARRYASEPRLGFGPASLRVI